MPSVKQEEGAEDGVVAVQKDEPIDHVHLDGQLARQLAAELDMEFETEIASHAPAVNVNTGFVQQVVHISDDESNDEVDMEEWSDDPLHAKLAARKLREQEKEDEDVAKKYEKMYDKNNGPREED